VGMAGDGGDPAVERLADLGDHDQAVGTAGPKRPEQLLPRLRQGVVKARKASGTAFHESIFSLCFCPADRMQPLEL
jgi:hypothetical protein